MRVVITDPAGDDLVHIEQYVSRHNITAAGKLIQRLEKRSMSLGDAPHIGTKRDYIRPGLRTIAEGHYVICYRVGERRIEVLRVLHGNMDIEQILAQLD